MIPVLKMISCLKPDEFVALFKQLQHVRVPHTVKSRLGACLFSNVGCVAGNTTYKYPNTTIMIEAEVVSILSTRTG